MTAAGLKAFLDRMEWSKAKLARNIGADRKTIDRYLEGRSPIPPYIALACTALAQGLPPME